MDNRVPWTDLCLSKFICWYPKLSTSECHVFVEKGFKEVIQIKWGHKQESLFNLTGKLTRKENWTQRDIRHMYTQRKDHIRTQQKAGVCKPRRNRMCWCLALVFQPSELLENKFLFKSVVFCYGSTSKEMHRKKNI